MASKAAVARAAAGVRRAGVGALPADPGAEGGSAEDNLLDRTADTCGWDSKMAECWGSLEGAASEADPLLHHQQQQQQYCNWGYYHDHMGPAEALKPAGSYHHNRWAPGIDLLEPTCDAPALDAAGAMAQPKLVVDRHRAAELELAFENNAVEWALETLRVVQIGRRIDVHLDMAHCQTCSASGEVRHAEQKTALAPAEPGVLAHPPP